MAFEGVAILMVGSTFIFFYLYTLFREREGEEWTRIINDNLANLFFGLGLIMIDVMLYVSWLMTDAAAYSFAPVVRTISLIIIFITVIVACIMLLKIFFVFLQMFFKWAIEKVGLMK